MIVYVALVNVRGAGSRRWERAAFVVLADLVVQLLIVILGLALLFDPDVLTDPAAIAGAPGVEDILFAFTIAIAAFSGLDASSALAGEVAVSRRGLKRLFVVRAAAAVPYLGIGLVASSVLPQTGGRWYEAPMLGLVSSFDQAWLREPLRYLVAVSALALLVIACNAAMFGLSRLGYSLALNRQIPSLLGRLHPRFDTPFVLIALGALLAIALVLPADLELLAAIYAFGATLAFTLVHLSVLRLRFREPERDRPYRIPFGIRIGAAVLPVSALLGALLSGVAFASVLYLHDAARFVGAGWLLFGVVLYVALPDRRGQADLQAGQRAGQGAHPARRRGGVRLDPRARARDAARRRHHADRGAARRRGERGHRRGRRGDRGALGVRDPDGAAARRARRRGRAQGAPARRSRAPRPWARSTRASRSPPRPCARAAPARRSCTRPSVAASRRSCSRRRSRPASAAASGSAARRACTTRSWARRRATCSRRRRAG